MSEIEKYARENPASEIEQNPESVLKDIHTSENKYLEKVTDPELKSKIRNIANICAAGILCISSAQAFANTEDEKKSEVMISEKIELEAEKDTEVSTEINKIADALQAEDENIFYDAGKNLLTIKKKKFLDSASKLADEEKGAKDKLDAALTIGEEVPSKLLGKTVGPLSAVRAVSNIASVMGNEKLDSDGKLKESTKIIAKALINLKTLGFYSFIEYLVKEEEKKKEKSLDK